MVDAEGSSLGEILWRDSGARAALNNLGLSPRGYRLVTSLPTAHLPRCVFRVSLSDGRTVKVRPLRDEEQAESLCRLRQSLPPGFVPVLARSHAVIIEPWIKGRPLRGCSEKRLAQAAALLRSLHGLHPPRPADPALYIDKVERGLLELVEAGKLSAASAGELRKLAMAWRPDEVSETLIHYDFCAENFVITPDDGLWVVDNESLRWGPPALDLARTQRRWTMSRKVWSRFLTLYEGPPPSPFWQVLARLRGALFRTRHQIPGAQDAVARLRELL